MNTEKTYSNPTESRSINDWPFGRNERATAHFTIEKTKRGERAVRVTVDPLTGRTFQPKKLTFAKRARIVDGSDGRTYIIELTESGFISVMQGNMKFQEETIFDNDPRFAGLMALFDVEQQQTATD
jgi:hypothetical protein